MEAVEKAKLNKATALKVLIADDDPPTRILLRAALSQWGYEIMEAKDGEEGWQILQQPNAPRLLIVDWLMPNLDGIGLCQRIKEKKDYHPYIILLTQMTGATNIVKGLDAGANEFLSKPFNMVELRSRLAVGARIIEYENLFKIQTAELEKNSDCLLKMKSLFLNYSNELKEALKQFSSNSDIDKERVNQIYQRMGKSIQQLDDCMPNNASKES